MNHETAQGEENGRKLLPTTATEATEDTVGVGLFRSLLALYMKRKLEALQIT